MNILIDSNIFIWLTREPERLSKKAIGICESADNILLLSSVSSTEISLKYHLKKLYLPNRPSIFIPQERLEHGIDSLPLDEPSSILLESLPLIHKDPFDRLLICQALTHDLTILTPDKQIHQYEVETLW